MINVICPHCNEQYHSQIAGHVKCKCGTLIKFEVKVPPASLTTPKPENKRKYSLKPTAQEKLIIAFVVIVLLTFITGFIGYCIHERGKAKNDDGTLISEITAATPTYSTRSSSTSKTTPIVESKTSSSEPAYNLCKMRIQNSFSGIDKTGAFKARLDSVAKTLTLTYIENPTEVTVLTKRGGGLTTFQTFRNNQLESEKTLYRRPDLEATNQYVYTSRTEEIKITIDYN
jgi:hypothetical protein